MLENMFVNCKSDSTKTFQSSMNIYIYIYIYIYKCDHQKAVFMGSIILSKTNQHSNLACYTFIFSLVSSSRILLLKLRLFVLLYSHIYFFDFFAEISTESCQRKKLIGKKKKTQLIRRGRESLILAWKF